MDEEFKVKKDQISSLLTHPHIIKCIKWYELIYFSNKFPFNTNLQLCTSCTTSQQINSLSNQSEQINSSSNQQSPSPKKRKTFETPKVIRPPKCYIEGCNGKKEQKKLFSFTQKRKNINCVNLHI